MHECASFSSSAYDESREGRLLPDLQERLSDIVNSYSKRLSDKVNSHSWFPHESCSSKHIHGGIVGLDCCIKSTRKIRIPMKASQVSTLMGNQLQCSDYIDNKEQANPPETSSYKHVQGDFLLTVD